jgi:polyphosphate kinase
MTTETTRVTTVAVPISTPIGAAPPRLDDPQLFINRELSWLEFNARVLAEAAAPSVPLFERLKFLAIFATNLDEFFMVRVAGLQAQLAGQVDEVPPDGKPPEEQLLAISKRAHELVAEQYRIWIQTVRPGLREVGVALVKPEELDPKDAVELDRYFQRNIFPALTPIVIDPSHPFPHVRNKSINVGVIFNTPVGSGDPSFGLVQVPPMLPRLMRVPLDGTRRTFVALEDMIFRHAHTIFPQMRVTGEYAFRVLRNFDIEIDEDEAEDLLL